MSIYVPEPISITRSSATTPSGDPVIENNNITNTTTVQNTVVSLNTNNLETSDNIILINSDETGNGITAGLGGIQISRGPILDPYQIVYNENKSVLEAGFSSNRGAIPILPNYTTVPNGVIPVWDSTAKKLSSTNYISSIAVTNVKNLDQMVNTDSDVKFNSVEIDGKNIPVNGTYGQILSVDISGNLIWKTTNLGPSGTIDNIVDSTGTTKVLTEQNAADKTIRLIANNNEVLTATLSNISIKTSLSLNKTLTSTTNYVINTNDNYIIYNGSSDTKMYLPDATANSGRTLIIQNNSSYKLTVTNLFGQNMLGDSIDIELTNKEIIRVISDGSNW